MEVAVIQSLARRLVALLMRRDPLSERVHLGKPALSRASASSGSSPGRPAASAAPSPRPMQPAMHESDRGRDQPATDRIAQRLRQLVLHGDAHPAGCAARRDVRDLSLLPARSTTSPTRAVRGRSGSPSSANGATRSTTSTQGKIGVEGRRPRRAGARIRPQARRLPRRHRRHGNGRARGHPRAELRHARSLLRPGGERGRTALGARVRRRGGRRHRSCRIISGARCSSPTSCATSTRTPASDGSICRARRSIRPASRPAIR